MEVTGDNHIKTSQSQKDKYSMFSQWWLLVLIETYKIMYVELNLYKGRKGTKKRGEKWEDSISHLYKT